jgi:hypothetical protein
MLVKRSNGLLVPILEDVETLALQVMHGLVLAGHHYIHKDEIRIGVQDGCRRVACRARSARD